MSKDPSESLPQISAYDLPTDSDIPTPRAEWKVNAARSALLIHDMQNYFLRAFGSGNATLNSVVSNINALRMRCRELGVPVFYTAQHGNQDQIERGLQRHFWGRGMPADGVSPAIVDTLAPLAGDVVLPKARYSAFHRNDFLNLLKEGNRDQLIVTGVYAHIGCLYTAADAFMLDIEPFFATDATADFSREHHLAAIRQAAGTCAVAASTAHLLEAL